MPMSFVVGRRRIIAAYSYSYQYEWLARLNTRTSTSIQILRIVRWSLRLNKLQLQPGAGSSSPGSSVAAGTARQLPPWRASESSWTPDKPSSKSRQPEPVLVLVQ